MECPLVYLGRMAGFKQTGRVYGPDLMAEICRQSVHWAPPLSVRNHPETLLELSNRLCLKYPGLNIVGTHSPPFRALTAEESLELRALSTKRSLTSFGLASALRSRSSGWQSTESYCKPPVLIGVGAAFDFHAGKVKQAPRWIQPLCLEWLFRLAVEPGDSGDATSITTQSSG